MIETKIDVSKIVLIVCTTTVLCVGMTTCSVDEETIQECQNSCKSNYTDMESATAFKCKCSVSSISPRDDPWVIPALKPSPAAATSPSKIK